MRWTIRGVPNASADAVRSLASEFEVTLAEVLAICIEAGLPEAHRRLLSCTYSTEHITDNLQRFVGVFQFDANATTISSGRK